MSDPGTRDKAGHLVGVRPGVTPRDDRGTIAWGDPKIRYVTERCRGRRVLDLGCVQHDPEFERDRLWLHKAIAAVAKHVVGLDLYTEGVRELRRRGYDVVEGDAEHFELGQAFEVIVAGDLIEHLGNFEGFFSSCAKHLVAGGCLILCTPNPWHWHRLGRAFYRDVPVNGEHTCWLCPKTAKQLASRFHFSLEQIEYGSQRWKDTFLPLPKRWRHTSWYATLRLDEGTTRAT